MLVRAERLQVPSSIRGGEMLFERPEGSGGYTFLMFLIWAAENALGLVCTPSPSPPQPQPNWGGEPRRRAEEEEQQEEEEEKEAVTR